MKIEVYIHSHTHTRTRNCVNESTEYDVYVCTMPVLVLVVFECCCYYFTAQHIHNHTAHTTTFRKCQWNRKRARKCSKKNFLTHNTHFSAVSDKNDGIASKLAKLLVFLTREKNIKQPKTTKKQNPSNRFSVFIFDLIYLRFIILLFLFLCVVAVFAFCHPIQFRLFFMLFFCVVAVFVLMTITS